MQTNEFNILLNDCKKKKKKNWKSKYVDKIFGLFHSNNIIQMNNFIIDLL